ncbi:MULTISPECIES: sulfite oxidase-like oxidoreductase [Sphingosinicellaceae]|uniref:sulfite oxidase-like oxidoreductase n=1 Tax=Sphingosinicellaceae TaxID=2820280 RepID=UPI001C1E2349|nr:MULTISPECIES: sulfite oxidase-like oxidoreductase [Polymorphobacter]QYE35652.1 sulfite oxidase-like oxidoreductase [Polymorphobacter sp. PAMC 29334]UAJ10983.1 sulfite oxidase-like oxidoreductase [Polymorphobacter megasporae]
MVITRGFSGRGRPAGQYSGRVPPGQHLVSDFPVLTAGPTPRTHLEHWSLSLRDAERDLTVLSWADFEALPQSEMTTDIHCVTKWTKLDTVWRGVTVDDLLKGAGLTNPPGRFVTAECDGGYTTNLPVADLIDGKAMVATHFGGDPLTPAHGGPARLLVPHLYFWKSAKWVRGLHFCDRDHPGFWESLGYHVYGDPWREQRYTGDA